MTLIGNETVRINRDGHRADVVIARPEKRNAMNEAVVADLTTAVERVDEDGDVRAVTLLGEGSVFCAGFQLEMMHEIWRRARRVPARVRGPARRD